MIRDFRQDDLNFCLESLAETHRLNFPEVPVSEELLEDLRPRFQSAVEVLGHTVLVYDDGGPEGFVWYVVSEYPGRGPVAHVNDLYVAPGMRGRGVGEGLMQAMEERVAAEGVTEIELTVSLVNQAALRLYRKLGYEVTRHLMVKELE
jgi:ribosomal protein S18 acetylase RimI-like enzyme